MIDRSTITGLGVRRRHPDRSVATLGRRAIEQLRVASGSKDLTPEFLHLMGSMRMVPTIDVVVLTRDEGPLRAEVARAIAQQQGVECIVHRVIGTPHPGDRNRHVTIARARNEARNCGQAPWMMFVDDDIVLPPDAMQRLQSALIANPVYGALGAQVLPECERWNLAAHVGMGATMFRRHVLSRFQFRSEPGRCECLMCCRDLRRQGIGIAYLAGLKATDLNLKKAVSPSRDLSQPRILAAFNRRHLGKFRSQFLRTLRNWGNREPVSVIGYGLYPSEQRVLASLPGIEVQNRPVNGVLPPIRRLFDFQQLVRELPAEAPVAYWDAADVVFQSSLQPLWDEVRAHPGKLLAVREPKSYPYNNAARAWSLSVRDADHRQRAFELMTRNPFLNSGFAAGTADAMLRYFEAAHRMRHGPELSGTSDWGDQMALNVYCHSQPEAWHEVAEGWNYCVHDRQRREFAVSPQGVMYSRRGTPIYVAHGNALSLRKLAIVR